MKKQDLLKCMNDDLLDSLFGFCYARTNDSHEAEELCSDILYALVKASHGNGEIENVYPFVWRIARNVYADFSENRRKRTEMILEGDAEEILARVADEEIEDDTAELLTSIYRRIAFLTKAYREVMIGFYLDGLSTAQIAKAQGISETAIRQRLFSARKKVKSEVENMADTYNRPVALDKMDYVIWGTGTPAWGDPREVCERMFSKHILWLCYKKPMRASEIAEELNVPTVYVEEELEILCRGENGKYGLLRHLENGKYVLNFILLDKDIIEQAHAIYREQIPEICEIIVNYIEEHKKEYLAFPYLNKKVDMNLILWQQIYTLSWVLSECVQSELRQKHFADVVETKRPFSVFGYVDNGKHYGGGWDGVSAHNICGFSNVHLENIYITRIKEHFHCGHNVSQDYPLQIALRAIDGLAVDSLTEEEKEQAAKAIECGYLYRDGGMLYTKFLVSAFSDRDQLFSISTGLQNGYFEKEAEKMAEKVAALIKKFVPEYLLGEWELANRLASMPVLDAVVEYLIEKGVLIPPADGIGAEGCWASVEK